MYSNNIAAFTSKASWISRVLNSSVNVSAHKKLFPEAEEKEFNTIWDTGATNTVISNRVVEQCKL